MKVFKIIDIPDLKTPVAPNEFLSRAKYVSDTSIEVKFAERFPLEKLMPHEPPNLMHNKSMEATKKNLVDLSWSDWELLKVALERTIKKEMTKRADARLERELELSEHAANTAIARELETARFRIFMTWLARFKMDRMFHQMGIRDLDDFKVAMRKFHGTADQNHRVMIEMFLRQFGISPNHHPTPIQMERYSSKDEILSRLKVEDDRTRLIDLSDARLKMAQLHAAAQFKHAADIQVATKDWAAALHDGPTETEKKIKGIKG
jgi:hypothetical protein